MVEIEVVSKSQMVVDVRSIKSSQRMSMQTSAHKFSQRFVESVDHRPGGIMLYLL